MKPIIVVKDSALDTYGNPFVQETTAQAIRGFTDEVNSDPTRSAVAQHPEDYTLHVIGHYDAKLGKITPLKDGPEQIARAKDLIRPKGE